VNSQRFDTLAKSLAAWSSRRRFLGGLAGLAGGSVLAGRATASAQETSPANAELLAQIQQESSEALNRLPSPDTLQYPPDDAAPDKPLFYSFALQVQDLFTQGSTAADQQWTDERVQLFLRHTTGLLSAVSIGAADAFFTDEQSDATPSALRTFPNTAGRASKKPTACTSECLTTAQTCIDSCLSDDHCVYQNCYLPFIDCYVGTKQQEGCIAGFFSGCTGDCHFGGG
jgi:hypothetical protein